MLLYFLWNRGSITSIGLWAQAMPFSDLTEIITFFDTFSDTSCFTV